MKTKIRVISISLMVFGVMGTVGCSAPLSTREKGGLIGAGLGAGTGAIIGSTVGHAAAGAAIGGPVGLVGGALIGDQLIVQEKRRQEQQRQMDQNQAELEHLILPGYIRATHRSLEYAPSRQPLSTVYSLG